MLVEVALDGALGGFFELLVHHGGIRYVTVCRQFVVELLDILSHKVFNLRHGHTLLCGIFDVGVYQCLQTSAATVYHQTFADVWHIA